MAGDFAVCNVLSLRRSIKKKGWFSKMKTKRIISLLAATAMTVTALTGAMSVSAETDSGDCGEVKWSFDSSTGKLTISGEGEMASPVTPNEGNLSGTGFSVSDYIKDHPDVYTYKKEHKEDIKEVVIEEGVTSVGFCAFYQMPNLETVVLPSTIIKFSTIRNNSADHYCCYSFAECAKLKNLTLTEGMTAIGGLAFYGCTSLESVRIPTTIDTSSISSLSPKTQWGVQTFADCTSLKNITLPEGLTGIGAQAFENTAVESVVIPSTVQNWGLYPPGNNTSYSNYAFRRCAKLSSVTFKEGLKIIYGQPFDECPLLKKLFIPASVTNIDYAFRSDRTGKSSFEEIAFEDGSQLTEIGPSAFVFCDKLKVLEIPENVVSYSINQPFARTSIENVYLYSETVDAPKATKAYCYSGSKAWITAGQNGSVRLDIEEEMSKTYKELSTAVKEANKYSEKDYTEESYGVLKALLEKAATKSEESHILGMKYLTEDIYSAIEGLRDKSEEPSSSNPSSDPSDSSNPSDNSSDPSNSSGNNNQSQSPNTPVTPSTSAPTTATPKPITPPTVTATTAKPAKVKAVKVKAKKKKLNVSWKKVSGATGYEVLSATNNKFTKGKKTVTVKKNKVTLKKLKPKKKYFVKVRAYKLANGRKYFGKWSKVVKKKVK